METSIETGRPVNPKPPLAPKPRITPKPFSLQKNTTIRSIHAPTSVSTTPKPPVKQPAKPEAPGVPKSTASTQVQKPPPKTTTPAPKPIPGGEPAKNKTKPTKENKAGPKDKDTPESNVTPGKSDPVSQNIPVRETPKPDSLQKDQVVQTNHKEPTSSVSVSEQTEDKKKENGTQSSVTEKTEDSGSDGSSSKNIFRWGGTRKSLSTQLTSKFESGGPLLPVQPTKPVSTNNAKEDATKAESCNVEQSQVTPTEPSNRESDEGGLQEDYTGGGSIKRRISLLFDSSSRPEVMTKKDEPEITNVGGGVKERIKHWALETNTEDLKTERKPQVAPRPRSKR